VVDPIASLDAISVIIGWNFFQYVQDVIQRLLIVANDGAVQFSCFGRYVWRQVQLRLVSGESSLVG
jgi:hypothetical protein